MTKKNEIQRLKFALSFVKPNGQFHDMFDYVHIDEKWFYMTKVKKTYYLVAHLRWMSKLTSSKHVDGFSCRLIEIVVFKV